MGQVLRTKTIATTKHVTSMTSLGYEAHYYLPRAFPTSVLRHPTALVFHFELVVGGGWLSVSRSYAFADSSQPFV